MCKEGYLDVFAESQVGQFEVCCGSAWQMYQQHAINRLAILIKDDHISKTSIGCILTDLFQRVPLQTFSVIYLTIFCVSYENITGSQP